MKHCGTNGRYPYFYKKKSLQKRKESVSLRVCKKSVETHVSNYQGIITVGGYLLSFILSFCHCYLQVHAKLLAVISVAFGVKDQMLFLYSVFRYLEKKWEYSRAVRQLFIDVKKPMIWLGGSSVVTL